MLSLSKGGIAIGYIIARGKEVSIISVSNSNNAIVRLKYIK